jgi:hypothetical protein
MPGNKEEKTQRKPGPIRRTAGRLLNFMITPVKSFPGEEVVKGGRLIGGLVESVKRRPRRRGGFRFHEDGSFDLVATAFLFGMNVHELEIRLDEKRRQSARNAYLCFGLGWVSFGAWLWRAATMPWTVGHILPAVEFAPFCLIFFLVAFQCGLLNYQIRRRRSASAWDYLTAEVFWPS